jgi:hypothetical protein
MGGIFLGFLCAVALVLVLGRLRASQPPSGAMAAACWGLIALTGIDGLNAFLFDGNLPHLYPPGTPLRLLTGLGAGLGVGLLAVPVASSVLWSRPQDEASIEDPIELVGGLALAALLGALILSGVGVLLWPIALLMLLGVVVAFGVANVYVLVFATGRARQASDLGDLSSVALSAFGLVLLELGGLTVLRNWLTASFGFTWGI